MDRSAISDIFAMKLLDFLLVENLFSLCSQFSLFHLLLKITIFKKLFLNELTQVVASLSSLYLPSRGCWRIFVTFWILRAQKCNLCGNLIWAQGWWWMKNLSCWKCCLLRESFGLLAWGLFEIKVSDLRTYYFLRVITLFYEYFYLPFGAESSS